MCPAIALEGVPRRGISSVAEEGKKPENKEELSLGPYLKEKTEAFARIAIILFFDTLLIAFWFAIRWALQWFADKVQAHGVHERCAYLLEILGPWFILAIAILHLAHDLVQEFNQLWRLFRRSDGGDG